MFRVLTASAVVLASSACAVAQPAAAPVKIEAHAVATGFEFTEGATLGPDGAIYFSDIPNRKVHRFDPQTEQVSVFMEDSGGSNGLHWDAEGRLVLCADRDRKVTRRQEGGDVEVLVEHYNGKKLNSPNDLDLDAEGGIYFTDPSWKNPSELEQDKQGVYYLAPGSGEAVRLIDDLKRPNGVAVAPDGKTLYVADNDAGLVMAYDIVEPGKTSNPRVFAQPGGKGGPDGMTTDRRGNLYAAWFSANTVYVWNAEGEPVATIAFGPDQPSNVELTADEDTIYITGGKVLQRASLEPLRVSER